jgi:hypothetical protein
MPNRRTAANDPRGHNALAEAASGHAFQWRLDRALESVYLIERAELGAGERLGCSAQGDALGDDVRWAGVATFFCGVRDGMKEDPCWCGGLIIGNGRWYDGAPFLALRAGDGK